MTQEELNKQQIKAYEDDIKDYLKKAKTCFTVAEALVLLSTLVAIINFSIGINPLGHGVGIFVGFGILFAAVPLFSILLVREFDEVVQFPHKDNEKKNSYIFYFVLFCPPVRWIIGSLFVGVITFAEMTGWYFGLACIPNIVGYIYIVKAYRTATDKWNIQYANEIQASIDYKEKQKQIAAQQAIERQREKEVNTVLTLLSKAGNKFFVKYYYELKDWSEPDILDIIQEDYTEETKLQRIRKGKEIFGKGLNKLALEKNCRCCKQNRRRRHQTKSKRNFRKNKIKQPLRYLMVPPPLAQGRFFVFFNFLALTIMRGECVTLPKQSATSVHASFACDVKPFCA